MNDNLIKKMRYADAWDEHDVCTMLSTNNPHIGNFNFFKNLLENAVRTKILTIVNVNEIKLYLLAKPLMYAGPCPIYKKTEIMKWISDKGFKIPELLSSALEMDEKTTTHWKEMYLKEMEISKQHAEQNKELEEKLESAWITLEPNHPNYATELTIANVISGMLSNKSDPSIPFKKQVIAKIKEHYPGTSNEACERIAIVINPDRLKQGKRT